ncbi:hypothetical protein [Caballeronia sordidicola]|uniref:hypothetical protein n=1 Tax=Caballeronia sordidicola TaxID=196367 RepID=UPI0015C5C411|nr:hypothetical protein [Caballeronia sordidicola]
MKINTPKLHESLALTESDLKFILIIPLVDNNVKRSSELDSGFAASNRPNIDPWKMQDAAQLFSVCTTAGRAQSGESF